MIKNCESSQIIELKRLCLSSIQAAINRLIEVGAWPRPERARILMVDRDIYEEEFDDLEELKCLIDFLASQELIQSMYLNRKSAKSSRRILREHWLMFLLNILSETDGEKVEKRIFIKWFNRFAGELYRKSDIWRAIYVLDGVELSGNVLNLDKFTKIIPVSKNTLKSLIPWQSSIPWYDRYFHLPEMLYTGQSLSPSGNAILVVTKRFPKEYQGSPWPSGMQFNPRERAISALAAIRLTQSGSVYMEYWGEFKVSRFRVLDPIGLDRKPDFGLRFYEHKVNIKKDSIHKIRSVWEVLMDSGFGEPKYGRKNPPSPLEIAMERYFKSYEDNDWYESLLDLTIALEALYGPRDKQELSHRIAMRCAWLVDEGQVIQGSTRNKTFDFVRQLYDLRSSLVHGGTPKEKDLHKLVNAYIDDKLSTEDAWKSGEIAVEITRDILRRSIEACSKLSKVKLPSGNSYWPFGSYFDTLMVVPGQQRKLQKIAGIKRKSQYLNINGTG